MGGGQEAASCPVCAVSHRGSRRSLRQASWGAVCKTYHAASHDPAEVDISGAFTQGQTTLSGGGDFRTLALSRMRRITHGPMTMDNTPINSTLSSPNLADTARERTREDGGGELITRNPNFFHYVLGADGEPRAAFDVGSEAHAYAKQDPRYEVLHRAELTRRFGERYRGYYAGSDADGDRRSHSGNDGEPVQDVAARQDSAATGALFDIQFEATGYTPVDLDGREMSEAQAAGYTATALAEGSFPAHVVAVVRGQISEDDAQDPCDRKVFATVTLRVSVEPGADAGAFQPPRVLLAYLTDLMAMDAAGEVPLTLAGGWQMTEIEPAGAALPPPARAAQAGTQTPPLAQASADPQRLLREMRAAFAVIARHTDDVAVKQFALEQFERLPLSLVDAIAAAMRDRAATGLAPLGNGEASPSAVVTPQP